MWSLYSGVRTGIYRSETEEVRDSKHKRDLGCHCWHHVGRPCGKTCEQSLEAKGDPWLTASKEMLTSVLQPQWTEFYQQSEGAEKQIMTQSLEVVQVTPSDTLSKEAKQLWAWTVNLWDCGLTNGCFKLVSWWQFFMQQQKTKTYRKEMKSHWV